MHVRSRIVWRRHRSGSVARSVAPFVLVAVAAFSTVGDLGRSGVSAGPAPIEVAVDSGIAPEQPPLCLPEQVTVWTARLGPGPDVAALRLRNDGFARCEVDVRGTVGLHRYSEPDVWLEPGATADFVVGPSGRTCLLPDEISEVAFLIGGVEVRRATAVVAVCGAAFTALYPNEPPDGPCTDLAATVVPGAVVLVNRSTRACGIGRLIGADGVAVMTPSASTEGLVEVDVLGPGDSAAVETAPVGPAGPCAPADRLIELRFDDGTVVTTNRSGCEFAVAVGPVRPWVGGLGGTSVRDSAPGASSFLAGTN